VCQSLRRWSTATLASLPRVVCIGGADPCGEDEQEEFERSTASVEVLDLSTMRWTQSDMSGGIPALPLPRDAHTASSFADGRVLVCGGNDGDNEEMLTMALQWTPESGVWAALPEMPGSRGSAASVVLSDGRAMVIGGWDCQAADGQTVLNSVLVLAADGSRWSQLPMAMASHRCGAAAVLLPGDKVLVASGTCGESASTGEAVSTKTAELWDPATQTWTALPDMLEAVEGAAACVLPSGCVAVVGGSVARFSEHGAAYDANGVVPSRGGQVYDPARCAWESLPEMALAREYPGLTAVAGGMITVGSRGDHQTRNDEYGELFDEESGRWFKLPRAMAQPRVCTCMVAVPVAALHC
jgi:hypothetical protein